MVAERVERVEPVVGTGTASPHQGHGRDTGGRRGRQPIFVEARVVAVHVRALTIGQRTLGPLLGVGDAVRRLRGVRGELVEERVGLVVERSDLGGDVVLGLGLDLPVALLERA